MPWDPSYDHFVSMLPPNVQFLIDEVFPNLAVWPSPGDFCSFISELVTRNPTMGIPALEDGLFANLLIFDYLCMYIHRCPRMSQYKPPYGEMGVGVGDGG